MTGHADLGETLTSREPEDVELVRLGRLEAQDFRSALAAAAPRQSATSKAEAEQAVAAVKAQWAPLMANPDTEARSQSSRPAGMGKRNLARNDMRRRR